MSGFTQRERDEEAARRKAADLERDKPLNDGSAMGPKAQCLHCHRTFAASEGHIGEVAVCDHCRRG